MINRQITRLMNTGGVRRRKKSTHPSCSLVHYLPTAEIPAAYEYFQQYFSRQVLENIALETNKYSVRVHGESIGVTPEEIEQYFPILFFSSTMPAATFRMYWSHDTQWSTIADIMSVNRFEKIKQCFHLVDNSLQKRRNEEGYDPLFKVRPLVESIRGVCAALEPEECQSMDEQVIHYKIRVNVKQFMTKKPTKWGIKVFARCSSTGMIHDFIIYTGKNSTASQPHPYLTSTGNIVRSLCLTLSPHAGIKIFFDNYFTSFDLMLHLDNDLGLHSVGTVRTNRLKGCPLKTEKEFKKDGRGSFDYCADANSNLVVVKWVDSGVVNLASTYMRV